MDTTADKEVGAVGEHESEGAAARRRVADADERTEVVQGRKVVEPDVSDEDAADATAWLLASFSDDVERPEHTLTLNVGSITKPKKIPWRIKALPVEMIDKIREAAMPATNRAMRRGGLGAVADPRQQYRANLRLIVEGTVEPDVRAVAKSTGIAAPEEFLTEAFRYNSGLVDIVASSILTLSGYDEDNVQDELDTKATGNS